MLHFGLGNVRTVLCLGAHADDIEIGCGGTMLELLAANNRVNVCWVVLSSTPERNTEAIASAETFLSSAAERQIVVKDFPDRFFPCHQESIKCYFDELGRSVKPDLIFTHRRDDMHQDHRVVAELTWNTLPNHTILEYEIPKYEGDLGNPSVFVPLSENTVQQKIETLMEHFRSQHAREWFCRETFRAMLRIRGLECKASDGWAEGFHARKLCLTAR